MIQRIGKDHVALAGERIEIDGKRRDERLTFTCLHFGDRLFVQDHAAGQLHVILALAQHPFEGLTRDGEGLVQWLADGITAMPGYSPEPAPATIRISFLKAYMQGLGTLKSANLVVRLQVTSGDLAPTNKNYRGVDRSLNWSNGEAEIQEGFERARIDLATQIAADLKKRCSG